ncbi:MAG: cold shock domain-containing protein [Methylomarinum sp.]|nr:cold shock domain-containing protein [Methylomarinum sp.]
MAMTESKGVLKTWKDDRGFGFIKPDDGSDDIFIHISALKGSERRPYRGETVYYQVEHGEDGKSKAVNARIEGVTISSEKKEGDKKGLWIAVVILLIVGIAAYFGMK